MMFIRLMIAMLVSWVLITPLDAFDTYYFSPDFVGSSARSVRLGGLEGMSYHADSVFENPASLYRIRQFSTSFFQTTFMEEVVYQNIAIAMKTRMGVLGLGFFNAGVDNIPKTEKMDYSDYTEYYVRYMFNYQNSLLKAAYQFSFSDYLHFGVSGSYFYSEFDTVKASGYNYDLGMVVDLGQLDFSVLIKNMMINNEVVFTDSEIGDNSSNDQSEKLSIQNIYSVNYRLRNYSIMAQLKTVGAQRELHRSVAFQLNPRFLPFIKGSVAYKQFPLIVYEEGMLGYSDKNSLVCGVELNLLGLNFNYAYERSDHIEFEHKNYFSVGLTF